MRVLVTGGAGFVGANVGLALAERHPDWEVIALDNLKRRGSELNLPRLREAGVDVRPRRRARAGRPAGGRRGSTRWSSARPSRRCWPGTARRPTTSSARNLLGAYHCLELARRDGAQFVFLSTSRVYPVAALEPAGADGRRRRASSSLAEQALPGVSPPGVSEEFPLDGAAHALRGDEARRRAARSPSTRDAFGLRTVIDRCGVIAGPWQMGKVDQGVFTHWLLGHHFGRQLQLHRLRRRGQAGARPAARRRPGRPDRGPAAATRALDGRRRQRRRRARRAACRCSRRPSCAAS